MILSNHCQWAFILLSANLLLVPVYLAKHVPLITYSATTHHIEKLDTHANLEARSPLLANASNSDIEAARNIVIDAIAQASKLNKARQENPVRNHYTLKPGTKIGDGISTKRTRSTSDHGTIPPPPLFTITPKIAAAAALVAEADAAKTAGVSFLKRDPFWMEAITRKGTSPWGTDKNYKVFRNVKTDYGAKGDGKTDDTAAINKAISDGKRCGTGCNGSTTLNAIVYLPAGTYLVSTSILLMFGTQFIGDANNPPTILAAKSFVGLGVLSTDYYVGGKDADGNDNEWYLNTANFYRQIRNLKVDITATDPNAQIAAIHYQIAQATSLQNVELIADSSTTQQGMFVENGSGGSISDVKFTGGKFGIWGGNQQFTAQRLTFNGCQTAVFVNWDWGWVWKSIRVTNANIGFNLVNGDGSGNVGSATFLDSTFTNVKQAIVVKPISPKPGTGTAGLVLDNVIFHNVSQAVADTAGKSILSGVPVARDWVLGPVYNNTIRIWSPGAEWEQTRQDSLVGDVRGFPYAPYFEREKPQYTSNTVSDFVHLKDLGAKGDGISDDTVAVQAAFNNNIGKIIFADAGVYLLTDTVTIPAGTRIVGETWTQFAATGRKFADPQHPIPMLRVGNSGDKGSIEMQDLLFTSKGATPGVILVEWNILADAKGSAGLWDCHARLGGATGTELTPTECPAVTTGQVANRCLTAALMFHITNGASGYFENMWLWTADHMIDDPDWNDDKNTMVQISVYTARGFLVESQNATWLYGTASEHSVFYQYNFNGARNVYAGMVQTESPYFQPSPKPPNPYKTNINPNFGDPDYACPGTDFDGCDSSWALIIRGSQDIYITSAGLYSWFSTYTQQCIDNQTCQHALALIKENYQRVRLQQLITIGAKYSIVDNNNGTLATDNLGVNTHPYWSQISIYEAMSQGDAPVPIVIPDLDPMPDACLDYDKYTSIDAVVNDTSINQYCINTYLISGMSATLSDSLATYNHLMDNGYSGLYKYYVKAVKSAAPAQFDKFYNSADLDKYFTCIYSVPVDGGKSYKNQTGPGCPPNNWASFANGKSYSIYFVANNMSDWLNFMENQYGVDRSWIVPQDNQFAPCVSDATTCSQYGHQYFYQVSSDMNVPDPAQAIKNNLVNYTGIANWLDETALLSAMDLFPSENADVVDGASISVYSVAASVAAMQSVEEIGKKEKESEALQIILLFIGAVLMLLPGIGEDLGSLLESTMITRMSALLADAGNLALTGYDIAKDPSSAPLAIGGLLVGGLASRDSSAFTSAAAKRRELPDSVIQDLTGGVSDGMRKLATRYKLCNKM